MGLPKQKHAIFPIVIPSTGKKVTFRPYTVKEDNILTQAKQSEDMDIIINSIISIINNCLNGSEDVKNLAVFDVEYILTNIRAKSVGEVIDLNMNCIKSDDHKKTTVRVDITKAQVVFPEGHKKNILLYDDVGIVMKYPTIGEMIGYDELDTTESFIACIDYIYSGEEIFNRSDYTKAELIDFIEGLTEPQMTKVKESFFDKLPEYTISIEFDCVECGHKNVKRIKGLTNFFI